MNHHLFNEEKIFQEFLSVNRENFGIEYIGDLTLALEHNTPESLYFVPKNLDKNFEEVGLLRVLRPVVLRDIVTKKNLGSVLNFKLDSSCDMLPPYGIFVKDGKLVVTNNYLTVESSQLCGIWNGPRFSENQTKTMKAFHHDFL